MSSDQMVPVSLVRQIVKATIDQAIGGARRPKILSGAVEDLDADTLDVAYVRMDQEAMGSDPTQSDNWGSPGVIPTTRLGETYVGEQVRVSFDGEAGASAMQTSTSLIRVFPFGAESGDRVIIDGEVGLLTVGDPGPEAPSARIDLDPVGGLRVRSSDDVLVGVLDQHGYTTRDNTTGAVGAELTNKALRIVDPAGTDDIVATTEAIPTMARPKYGSASEPDPGSTIVAPAIAKLFSTDDLELYHAVASRALGFTGTYTPPSGCTERVDTANGTMAVSIATRDPATTGSGTFTQTQTDAQTGIGTSVAVRGPGAAYRAVSEASFGPTNDTTVPLSLAKPTGTAAGDILVAFISMTNQVGSVPLGWTTPEGWVFLGAIFQSRGAGATLFTTAVGVWAKLAGASEPATYDITITFGAGTKRLHAAIVAVQSSVLIPGGPQITVGGYPVKRLLRQVELSADATVLFDEADLPGNYRHLELVWDAVSGTGTDVLRNIQLRLNNDTGANYSWQLTDDGTGGQATSQTGLRVGAVNGAVDGHETAGKLDVFDYTRTGRKRVVRSDGGYTEAGNLHEHHGWGFWTNTADIVTRVTLLTDSGTTDFKAGSRAWLYGW